VVLVGSTNVKTADMAQVYILHRDIAPGPAVHSGADSAVCGNCPHRGSVVDGRNTGRTCYVLVFQGPRSVWESYRAGRYPVATLAEVRARLGGKPVRLGAYGDPAALPAFVSAGLVDGARKHTGYTHQWRGAGALLRDVCMASVDTPAEAAEAAGAGWRYFRVAGAEGTLAGEIVCPASEAAGKVTTCDRCGLCNGARPGDRRKNIVILAHGNGAAAIRARAVAVGLTGR
jgi:hypothetical protein